MTALVRADNDLTPRRFRWGLVGCYGLHVAICALFVLVLFPHGMHRPHLLYVTRNDDQLTYFSQAQSLVAGHLPSARFPIGNALLLAPFVALLHPRSSNDLGPVVSLFWGIGAYGAGVVLMGEIARRLLRRRSLALVAVGLWTLVPLALWAGLSLVHPQPLGYQWSVWSTWMSMISDPPETLCALAVIYVYLRGRESASALWPLALGALAGFGVLLRFTGFLLLAAVALALVWERRWKALALCCSTAAGVGLPQVAVNAAIPMDQWGTQWVRLAPGTYTS